MFLSLQSLQIRDLDMAVTLPQFANSGASEKSWMASDRISWRLLYLYFWHLGRDDSKFGFKIIDKEGLNMASSCS